jgi:hypothetical protein
MGKLAVSGGEPVRSAPWPPWPVFDDEDERALLEVLRSGNWWRHSYGQGVELAEDEADPRSTVARFQRAFARAHECRYGICAANGTVTMEIGLRALGIQPGDEVIVPAHTYVATATAPLMVGAIPIFVDIDADTYNMDPVRVEEAVTDRTPSSRSTLAANRVRWRPFSPWLANTTSKCWKMPPTRTAPPTTGTDVDRWRI